MNAAGFFDGPSAERPEMRRFAKWVLWGFAILVVTDAALTYFVTSIENFPYGMHPSRSIAESKSRGAFVGALEITPALNEWNGNRIAIDEAWVEHSTELVCDLMIIPFVYSYPFYRVVDGYEFCLNITDDSSKAENSPFFVIEGRGSGFTESGGVYWTRLTRLDQCPRNVILTDNWKFENSRILNVKRS